MELTWLRTCWTASAAAPVKAHALAKLLVLAFVLTGVSGCATPAGLTMRSGMAQMGNTISSHAVPVDSFDALKEADMCRSVPGCTSFLVMPTPSDEGPYSSMKITLKSQSNASWVWVDPMGRADVGSLCVGTFLLNSMPPPSPTKKREKAPEGLEPCTAPAGWTYQLASTQKGNTMESYTVVASAFDVEETAERCDAMPPCNQFSVFPDTPINGSYKPSKQLLVVQLKTTTVGPWASVGFSGNRSALIYTCYGTFLKKPSPPSPPPSPVKQCEAPKGWTFTEGKRRRADIIATYTLPAATTMQYLADKCKGIAKCALFYVQPAKPDPATGRATKQVVEFLKAPTKDGWQSKEIKDGKLLQGMCHGTFTKAPAVVVPCTAAKC